MKVTTALLLGWFKSANSDISGGNSSVAEVRYYRKRLADSIRGGRRLLGGVGQRQHILSEIQRQGGFPLSGWSIDLPCREGSQ